ncbi:MAG: hypothetical protein HYZ43_12920 [Flavobacteriia bacterium]|nr:hypothetical protein [Flavobacteriia bacterium]
MEWKHRFKPQESVQKKRVIDLVTTIESVNADSVVNEIASIRSTEFELEKSVAIHQGNVSEGQMEDDSFTQRKMESPGLSRKNDEVNRATKTNATVKKESKKKSERNGGMALLGILFSLAVLIMPPILFSVAAYWIDLSSVGLAFVWIIWAMGIVGALLLFSGLWPMILSCLIWNIIFTVTTLIILLVNS